MGYMQHQQIGQNVKVKMARMVGWYRMSFERKEKQSHQTQCRERDIGAIGGYMETFVTFMKRAVTQKNTLFGTKLKFAIIIGAYMWPACTSKHFKERIVRCFT
jgi:hypothetical protein